MEKSDGLGTSPITKKDSPRFFDWLANSRITGLGEEIEVTTTLAGPSKLEFIKFDLLDAF
jgi:hypothetical protein